MDDVSRTKAKCAALAFHKALIGIAQLDALETMAGQLSSLYGPRGIYTYYIAYHLFCACMLIIPEKYCCRELKPPAKYQKTTEEQLNDPSELPKQWDDGRDYEADWATKIIHFQIKEFCEHLRKEKPEQWEVDAPYMIPLYRYFIDDRIVDGRCIPALYNKLCYVRDRVVYRPSYVLLCTGEPVQTSAQLGLELQSLPDAAYLYQALCEVYDGLLICMERERQSGECKACIDMLTEMWFGRVNEGDLSELCLLGHQESQLKSLGSHDVDGAYSFLTYISHLLEMESMDFILKYKEKYWEPLEKLYHESWETWRARKVNNADMG